MPAHAEFVAHLVKKGGPRVEDYIDLDQWIVQVHKEVASGFISGSELAGLRSLFGDALSINTLQGFAFNKPYGYAGDFEIIERIYRGQVALEPELIAWDRYFHRHAATKAVRNRKAYFHRLLDKHYAGRSRLNCLNVGSGPGRCMAEWFDANPEATVTFTCVEVDDRAIRFASELTARHGSKITFIRHNAMSLRLSRSYDLIWVAGVFDYLSDKAFKALFRRLLDGCSEGGELVIGNFAETNPSRCYMELIGDWWVNHRTPRQLVDLALASGVRADAIHVGAEPEGVNLFLHVSA